jgi:hypothetical protein
MRHFFIACWLIAFFGGIISCSVCAQSSTGTIHGHATDDKGAAVPDVQVTIKNLNTNGTTVVRTDTNGFFRYQTCRPDSIP